MPKGGGSSGRGGGKTPSGFTGSPGGNGAGKMIGRGPIFGAG